MENLSLQLASLAWAEVWLQASQSVVPARPRTRSCHARNEMGHQRERRCGDVFVLATDAASNGNGVEQQIETERPRCKEL
jgi:hypothetical protein